jgi:hypothetical protein
MHLFEQKEEQVVVTVSAQ